MIKVIGRMGCSACLMTKKVLTRNKIEFNYVGLEEMSKEEQDNLILKARNNGVSSLPFIIKDGEFVDLKEVI